MTNTLTLEDTITLVKNATRWRKTQNWGGIYSGESNHPQKSNFEFFSNKRYFLSGIIGAFKISLKKDVYEGSNYSKGLFASFFNEYKIVISNNQIVINEIVIDKSSRTADIARVNRLYQEIERKYGATEWRNKLDEGAEIKDINVACLKGLVKELS